MADLKRIGQVVILVLLIIGGAGFGIFQWHRAHEIRQPEWVQERMSTKIDIPTGELISKPSSYWKDKGPDENRYYVNEKTGKRTIYDTTRCTSCGKLVPTDPIPLGGTVALAETEGEDVTSADPGTQVPRSNRVNYLCPYCGDFVYPPLARMHMSAGQRRRPLEGRNFRDRTQRRPDREIQRQAP